MSLCWFRDKRDAYQSLSSLAEDISEKMKQTLKAMLQNYAGQAPKPWDTCLPFLGFAYKEIP